MERDGSRDDLHCTPTFPVNSKQKNYELPKITGDFREFTDFMKRLVAVPHSQIKARLDEERRNRNPKRRKKASAHVSGDKG